MTDNSALDTVRDSLTAARDSLADVHMDTPLGTIVRRGRTARRRRRGLIGLTGTATVAAGAALAVGLTGVTGSAPEHPAGTIRTAAFTIVSHANGTATLTVNPKVLFEPGVLQRDLERDGIPARVPVGSFCSSEPTPAGIGQVVSFPPPAQDPSVTINPAAMPAGTELSFGNFQLTATSGQTYVALVDGSSYTCSSGAPTARPFDGTVLGWHSGHQGGTPAP
jgi:hypothetical protein